MAGHSPFCTALASPNALACFKGESWLRQIFRWRFGNRMEDKALRGYFEESWKLECRGWR